MNLSRFYSIYNIAKEENCLNEICEDNKNYDEAFHFIYFLTVENDGNSNFSFDKLFKWGKIESSYENKVVPMDSVEVIE